MRAQTPGPRPFLSLLDATFRLGDRLIFQNTNWIFHRDEHWAVVGANGSGKSLFSDALRGRLPLIHGELCYHFRPPPGFSAEDAIGHVSFEERKSELHEMVVQSRWNSIEAEHGIQVREFLSYERVLDINPFEVREREQQRRQAFERRLRRAVSLLRLDTFRDQILISLSNGERQRLQLARALCHPLRLLILDEPYIGLDVRTREHLHDILERLMRTSLRVLIITTRPEELPTHITHLLHIDNCWVVRAGPRELRGRHDFKPSSIAMSQEKAGTTNNSPHPGKHALVQLSRVTVRYGTRPILNQLSWTIFAGESWALLGPNGSGKSTLLSLILGDNPQAYMNEVIVFGQRRGAGESIWEIKKQIGWVSPELQLHFDDTISCSDAVISGFYETIGLFERPTARQRKAAHKWLARFQLLRHADSLLCEMSAGLQRMVLLARALVKSPRLLILDEPCQGLDEPHRALFLKTIDGLIRDDSVTAIYVTHRADEIPSSIKRIKRLSIE